MQAEKAIEKSEAIAKAVNARGGKTYFAGGFVRDELLGIPVKDIDLEVHGISAEELKKILEDFGNVITTGKSFGVYSLKGYDMDIAMPRTEKNTGMGHRDFEIFTDPFLGPEAAAGRRDFTMNAMMKDVLTGEIIDLFGGRQDLENGTLRHVNSKTFGEDPLRVLRGAQFAARFNMKIAPETVRLCRNIDLSALPKERIEKELEKGLCKSRKPSAFFETLAEMDQLDFWFAEVKKLKGVPQDPLFHPEGDVWSHTMECLNRAADLREKTEEPFRFMLAVLAHDFGKVGTTEEIKGRVHSYGHEQAGVPAAEAFLRRITSNREIIKYVKNMVELHMKPNVLAGAGSSVKATNRMFDASECPEELILLSGIDRFHESHKGEGKENLEFLNSRLETYREYMARPYVGGKDLIEAGFEPDENFSSMLEYAHKLRLAGVDRDSALKQVIAFAGSKLAFAGKKDER